MSTSFVMKIGKRHMTAISRATLAALLAMFLVASSVPSIAQSFENDLREQTEQDIIAAVAILREHHPGISNPYDPGFSQKLDRAEQLALHAAKKVQTQVDRQFAIAEINRALADEHAFVQTAFDGSGGQWPGFETVWRGDALYVSYLAGKGPPVGSRLLSCDGVHAKQLIRDDVFRLDGRAAEPGQWWQRAGLFFLRGDLSSGPLPGVCRFERTTGYVEPVELHWQPYPMEQFERIMTLNRPEPLGLSMRSHDLVWVSLPTFSPDADGIASYQTLLDQLSSKRSLIDASRAIVLDMRGNKGGSSSWSRKIADALWGRNAVGWVLANYFRKTEVWYLADSANIAHFAAIADDFHNRGMEDIAEWAAQTSASLGSARQSGERFWKEPYGARLLAKAAPRTPNNLPPVYVVVDGGCVSACLDAVDTFTRFNGVKLVGAPTSADSEYMEIRREELPSGRGSVVLPTKIWIDRPRAPGAAYTPDIPVTDVVWSTDVIMAHIEQDLRTSAQEPK